VYDETLQHEILTKNEELDLEGIIRYCENHEATKRDTVRLKSTSDRNDSGVNHILDNASEEEIVAAMSMYRRQKNNKGKGELCGRCGYSNHDDEKK
jgi:rubrerythrin